MHNRSVVLAAVVASLGVVNTVSAQDAAAQPTRAAQDRWTFVSSSGTLIPTGDQGDMIQRGGYSTAQLIFVAHPLVAINATAGWARSRDLAAPGAPKLDLFTYDAGAELRSPYRLAGKGFSFAPFAGAGAGARSYNHRKLDVDATHTIAAYGSVGGELGYRRVRVRLEARDYVSEFKPLIGGGESRTANDVVMMAGLRIVGR